MSNGPCVRLAPPFARPSIEIETHTEQELEPSKSGSSSCRCVWRRRRRRRWWWWWRDLCIMQQPFPIRCYASSLKSVEGPPSRSRGAAFQRGRWRPMSSELLCLWLRLVSARPRVADTWLADRRHHKSNGVKRRRVWTAFWQSDRGVPTQHATAPACIDGTTASDKSEGARVAARATGRKTRAILRQTWLIRQSCVTRIMKHEEWSALPC